MLVFLNGKFIPEEQATVSVFDRSFCLSDGLFEALPVYSGKMFLWEKHWERLRTGADFLKIKIQYSPASIRAFAEELLAKNQATDCILRIQLSRGVGLRGYSIKGADAPTLVMSLHPARKFSSPCKIITSSVRILADDPLTNFKSCSKLSHILARMEADEQGADEALLLNTNGNIAEATSANLFWIENKTVCTPPLNSSALPGVTRGLVLELCDKLKIPVAQKNITPALLPQTEGAFLTSVAIEVREVSRVDEYDLRRSLITQMLRDAYLKYVEGAN
ncbi:MAG: aminotransferase class IV [Verrucomicrobiota bacterium]